MGKILNIKCDEFSELVRRGCGPKNPIGQVHHGGMRRNQCIQGCAMMVAGKSPSRQFSIPQKFDRLSGDRKSTRLNSSHTVISYAVFCLKKKKTNQTSKLLGN